MHKAIVAAALLLTTSTIALAQQDRATDITAAQVQQVLKAPSKIVDHTLKVVDLGKYSAFGRRHQARSDPCARCRRAARANPIRMRSNAA